MRICEGLHCFDLFVYYRTKWLKLDRFVNIMRNCTSKHLLWLSYAADTNIFKCYCRDLNREQIVRKRLHNEMEDMKGAAVVALATM